ncbi:hypothetical protein DL766_000400 [Monosporascus sp. MC13-8B]|uniref:NFACT RNA-binding domain-containing protein n=1 Tax=Monosporascus cannonballus TaxID=155416 RepID=A0ABY0H198_9PEZI|nr:hypothetical protein DL762_007808 [Monosporascus cannonballus]RYO99027.1 hypothetical protein DL763_001832 [Monosporascus cannonballus]RYP39375.1 hypothetical protein DL766_000400 [Monosporascus sp. MC13-8B]
MKQRFSSLDVKVVAHELSTSLVSLRLHNIYDLSSRILLLKFSKPNEKKQLLIDSGFRCHLTDFDRTTADFPSSFVQKLRKVLKTRRVTAVSQIGTDRIIEFQFSDGRYRLYLEFFAGGNVILTDHELNILTLLRNVPEGEGQEHQRAGLKYSLQNRQNYNGVPELTKERVRDALQTTVQRAANAAEAGKKIRKKPGDELRKGLATTINELPPILIDHAMKVTSFDSTTQPAAALENESLLDHLLQSLREARKIVDQVTGSATCKGYILAKKKAKAEDAAAEDKGGEHNNSGGLLYEDFHPFLPRQFEEDPAYTVLTFDNYNKLVDEFFSSIEGQKLKSRLTEKEAAAKRKLDAAKADQAKRIEGLQSMQLLNIRKAEAIEANVERVQEAMDAINSLIGQGMDWEDIGKLVERQRRLNNPVAAIIMLPLKLHENTITVLLGEAEEDEGDEDGDETDSAVSDSADGAAASMQKAPDRRLAIDINLGLSPWGNAREYYGEKKVAAVKQEKTVRQSEIALKSAEQKIAAELKKGLKLEKPTLQPIRRQMWFEKFTWFISSDGYVVLGGRDASQNEMLYRRYLRKGDIYVHADLHGAASVVIKNNPKTPDAPIPPSTLSQAGSLAVCSSSAWDSKAVMSAWWVNADQVSKSAPTGEYLPTGSFMVRGKKNFLPPAQLLLGFALAFKISEESKARHIKHRQYDDDGVSTSGAPSTTASVAPRTIGASETDAGTAEGSDTERAESDSEDSVVDVGEDEKPRANPLQTIDQNAGEDTRDEVDETRPTEGVRDLTISDEPSAVATPEPEPESTQNEETIGEESENGAETSTATASQKTTTEPSANPTTRPNPQPQRKGQQPKRGKRGKAKKIAAKYKDQDEEDRAAVEALIGAAAGRKKAQAEAKAKAEREAQQTAALERRRAQHVREQRETAEHEEVRRVLLEEGLETLGGDEAAHDATPLDALIGTPLPGDEILEAIPFCAPYAALSRCKYKAKLQPGSQKKGKAVKEVLERWRADSGRKGALDETARDMEKMWPREVELIKALKPEDAINCIPVGKLRVVMSGGGGGGSGAGGGGKFKKGGAGARGKKG